MRRTRRLASCAASLAVLVAWTPGAMAASFNASIWFPETHPLTNYGYVQWLPQLRERTDGSLDPRLFTGTALLPPEAHLSGLKNGIAQLTYHAGTYTPQALPIDNVLSQLMFSYSEYFVTAFAFADMAMTNDKMRAQYRKNDIVFAGSYSTPPYRLFCTSKITKLSDLEGKSLRLMISAAHSSWAKKVGAIPVNAPSSEMYGGLDKGQLDCVSNGANDLESRSLWDVAKHVTLVELGVYWSGWEYAFNRDFWQDMSAEQRRAVLDTIAEAIVVTGQGYLADAAKALEKAKGHDVTIHEPSADLTKSIEEHASAARELAIEHGKERLNIKKPEVIIRDFEERLEKWRSLLSGVDRNNTEALTRILKQNLYNDINIETYGMQ